MDPRRIADASPNDRGMAKPFDFSLPPELEAAEPPEARGLKRDQVRLMVTGYSSSRVQHAHFHDFPDFVESGDVVVVNTSATRNAALAATRQDRTPVALHLSTHLDDGLWTVEPRSVQTDGKTSHFDGLIPGESLQLPGGGSAMLRQRYVSDCEPEGRVSKTLWIAEISLPTTMDAYLQRWGFPIRYNYVKDRWPLEYYQTVYATEAGSAEMPSAGRAFTAYVLDLLAAKGVQVLPLILHTGVSNIETHEPPYKEFYRVPALTARRVSQARREGGRVVAVGTTVVRALESATDNRGNIHAGEGWTCLVVTPKRGLRVVSALLTGFHEPEASHLSILEALAGRPHIEAAYREALQQNYLWHEFGDLHLIVP